MRVTAKDIAEICGVSRTTVTRALTGTGRISRETKEKIMKKAEELGYQPDLAARSLVSGRSMMIGVTIVDLNNLYFPKIIDAIEKRAREEDYVLMITLHEDSRETEKKLLHTLVSHRVDGLILNPVNKGADFQRMMHDINVPCCILGLQEMEDYPSVGVDEFEAGCAAAKYIFQKGYRSITFVAPQLYDDLGLPNFGHDRRWQGVRSVAAGTAHKCELITGLDYCAQIAEKLRYGAEEKTAFLCSGAAYAVDVMRNMAKLGFLPPNDYGLMSFDLVEAYRYNEIQMTTVDNHTELQGYYAGDLLIKLIQGKETFMSVSVPFDIVEGQTL